MTAKLPTERIVYQFKNASVVYSTEYAVATGKIMPKLEVMVIDAYGFQREFRICFRHRPGNSSDLFWEVRTYQHPGRRDEQECSEYIAKEFISRFLHLCEKYPDLLFNETNENRSRHDGFVHFVECIHRGQKISKSML